jgi:hypothetical protein
MASIGQKEILAADVEVIHDIARPDDGFKLEIDLDVVEAGGISVSAIRGNPIMSTLPNPPDVSLPVQKQLEAYNARDIDAFMQWWAEDCLYYAFPSQLLAQGTAEIRQRHFIAVSGAEPVRAPHKPPLR